MVNKKILSVFGNVAFYGQEQVNLQVFELLKNYGYAMFLVVNLKLMILKCKASKHQIINTIQITLQKCIRDEFFKLKHLDLHE
jgi:hypothetical protein